MGYNKTTQQELDNRFSEHDNSSVSPPAKCMDIGQKVMKLLNVLKFLKIFLSLFKNSAIIRESAVHLLSATHSFINVSHKYHRYIVVLTLKKHFLFRVFIILSLHTYGLYLNMFA